MKASRPFLTPMLLYAGAGLAEARKVNRGAE
jgi:hypothetical protein